MLHMYLKMFSNYSTQYYSRPTIIGNYSQKKNSNINTNSITIFKKILNFYRKISLTIGLIIIVLNFKTRSPVFDFQLSSIILSSLRNFTIIQPSGAVKMYITALRFIMTQIRFLRQQLTDKGKIFYQFLNCCAIVILSRLVF